MPARGARVRGILLVVQPAAAAAAAAAAALLSLGDTAVLDAWPAPRSPTHRARFDYYTVLGSIALPVPRESDPSIKSFCEQYVDRN